MYVTSTSLNVNSRVSKTVLRSIPNRPKIPSYGSSTVGRHQSRLWVGPFPDERTSISTRVVSHRTPDDLTPKVPRRMLCHQTKNFRSHFTRKVVLSVWLECIVLMYEGQWKRHKIVSLFSVSEWMWVPYLLMYVFSYWWYFTSSIPGVTKWEWNLYDYHDGLKRSKQRKMSYFELTPNLVEKYEVLDFHVVIGVLSTKLLSLDDIKLESKLRNIIIRMNNI